jgi:hypothetical protein
MDALGPSESPDRPPVYEPVEDQLAKTNDEPEDDAPHLTGPVLAPTPREFVYPVPETPDQIVAERAPHTLAGPVLAPTPHRLAAPPTAPAAGTDEDSEIAHLPEQPEPSHPVDAPEAPPGIEVVDNVPEPLIDPPLDFRRRLVIPPTSTETPQQEDGSSKAQDASNGQPLAASD